MGMGAEAQRRGGIDRLGWVGETGAAPDGARGIVAEPFPVEDMSDQRMYRMRSERMIALDVPNRIEAAVGRAARSRQTNVGSANTLQACWLLARFAAPRIRRRMPSMRRPAVSPPRKPGGTTVSDAFVLDGPAAPVPNSNMPEEKSSHRRGGLWRHFGEGQPRLSGRHADAEIQVDHRHHERKIHQVENLELLPDLLQDFSR